MIFRKQTFLGQVPLGQSAPSGVSTWVAQELCKALDIEANSPGQQTKNIKDLWGRVSGVKRLEDEVRGWLKIWCPQLMNILDFKIAARDYPPRPPVPTPEPPQRPPVPTPGRGGLLLTHCYECAPGQYKIMLALDAERQGCKNASMNKCRPPAPNVKDLPPVPSVDVARWWRTAQPLPPVPGPPRPPSIYSYPSVATPRVSRPETQPPTAGGPPVPTPTSMRTRSPLDVMSTAFRFQSISSMAPMATMTSPMAMMAGPRRIGVINLGGSNEDLAWFEANRIQIAQQYPGQYVIIKDQAVRGAYPDFQAAYNAGVTMYGTQSFEVKQAVAEQPTEYA